MTDPRDAHTCTIEELTLVVVGNEHATRDEPYWGYPSTNDGCHIFAQAPAESCFLFDLRLRECLSATALLGSLSHAVLVCDLQRSDRELLRRARLVATRIRSSGTLTLAYQDPCLQSDVERLRKMATFASIALQAHRIQTQVLAVSQLNQQPAPLTAAWERLQRLRLSSTASCRAAGSSENNWALVARRVVQTITMPSAQDCPPKAGRGATELSPFIAAHSPTFKD